MARRKMAPRRRRNNGIKLLNVAEAYVQANIVTQKLMQTDPISFVVGDAGPTLTVAGGGISLIEIVRNPALIGTIGARAAIPDNIIDIAVKSFIANASFKFAKRALRRPINMFNRQVMKPLALGVSL
tara:strand:+ start:863 stop:1243 length:381 start_codon:yes stop_codon:yes gene_type:complete